MSSYLNNLLTNTTSRYTNLRRQLLSDENDGDTEEDSHISRVLRAYYTEKGRPYPQWLPPDPRAPQPQPAQQFVSSAGRQQSQGVPMGRGGGGLSDLWDSPAPQQQSQQPQSLRRGTGAGAGSRPLQGRMGSSLTPEPQGQGRPLPSQRAGSYQSSLAAGGFQGADPSPPPSAGGGTTAQERLKQRLWGSGRSTSPAPSTSSVGSGPPARGSYERPAASSKLPYPDDRGYSASSGGGGRQQASSGDYDPYAPGSYGGGGAPQRGPPNGGRQGLPSGPRLR